MRRSLWYLRSKPFFAQLAAGWAFFILWVVLTPSSPQLADNDKVASQRLSAIEQVIKTHIKERGFAPFSLREVAIYAGRDGSQLSLSDGLGQRFKYYAFGLRDWLVHAFSPDGFETSLAAPPSPFVASWQPPLAALLGEMADGRTSYAYAPMSLGTLSPDGRLSARLYQHPLLEKSWLVVQDPVHDRLTMVAFHDGVEEFLWLPGSYQLVFAAAQSTTYQDGIYLWDLRSHTTRNLLAEKTALATLSRPNGSTGWYIKLYSYDTKTQTLAFWALPKIKASLAPAEFFAAAALRQLPLFDEGAKVTSAPAAFASAVPTSAANILLPAPGVCHGGDSVQLQWCALPIAGGTDEVLERWQAFVENTLETPLFAYGLWTLAFFYHDAYRLWKKLPPGTEIMAGEGQEGDLMKTQEILKSYSIELARALLEYPLAPAWQKATSRALWEALTSSEETLNFELAKFEIGPQRPLPPTSSP